MYSRRVCYALPDKTNEINSKSMQSTLQQIDSLAKQKWLDYTAVKRRPKESSLNVGDRVLVKQTRQEKLLLKISSVQTVPIPHNRSERDHVNRKTHVNQP